MRHLPYRRALGLALALAMIGLALPSAASARRQIDYPYGYAQVWGAMIRLLRVDYGFRILDRDPEVGYLLFEYVEGSRAVNGSVEIVRTGAGADSRVRVVLQVQAMPSYIERMILERLSRKLCDDFGAPPPRALSSASPPADSEPEPEEAEEETRSAD